MTDGTNACFPFQWDKERLYNATYESMRADGSWDEEQCAIVVDEMTKLLLLADDYYSDNMDELQIGNEVAYRLNLILNDQNEDRIRFQSLRKVRTMVIVAQWLNERGYNYADVRMSHGQMLWLMLIEIKKDKKK